MPWPALEGQQSGCFGYFTASGEWRPLLPPTVASVLTHAGTKLTAPAWTAKTASGITLPSTSITDFTEAAQDAVGAMAANSSKVSLTYVDGTPSLTADIVAGSLGAADIANRTRSIEITKFVLQSGTPAELIRGANLRYTAWDFDGASIEGVATPTFQVPRDWASGALSVFLHWTNLGAGAGNVVWRVVMNEKADAADLNSTTSEANTDNTIAAPTQNVQKISGHTVSFTPSAAGVHVILVVARIGNDAADTLANDAGLLKVQVTYTADS